MDREASEELYSSGRKGNYAESRKAKKRKSTTDVYGNSTVEVEEDVIVVPASHLLNKYVSWDTGGAFQKGLEKFFDDYYEGKVVLGRLANGQPHNWEESSVDRSPHGFFVDYPPIVREKPPRLFKLTWVEKKGK